MAAEIDPMQVGLRLEQLLGELDEHAPPEVAPAVQELAELLMDMYGAGLARIVTLLDGTPQLDALAVDEVVSGLLVLHDLHPEDTATRATRALDSVRPYLGSHAGDVDLLGVDDGPDGPVVRLALRGSCDGCPSSAATVKGAIETALAEACPEVVRVDVDGVPSAGDHSAGPADLPLLQIGTGPPVAEVPVTWMVVEPPPLRPGRCAVVDVAGQAVLVALPAGAHADGGPVAYRDRCPRCAGSLADGELRADELRCPGCAAGYDVRRAGRALDGPTHLEPLPLVQRAGGWRVALPAVPPDQELADPQRTRPPSGWSRLPAGSTP
ncbi:MAG TPA: NifU family protein [Pseudonocardia sp.]|jgi:Fe-S cluster biogenesis protein NfuA/nitrite reductase/ring-hydroxylating ferredoxin subunit